MNASIVVAIIIIIAIMVTIVAFALAICLPMIAITSIIIVGNNSHGNYYHGNEC